MKPSFPLLLLFLFPCLVGGQAAAPPGFEAFDTPNDGGGSITVTWPLDEAAPRDAVYNIYVAELANGPFHLAASVAAGAGLQSENPAVFGFGPETARHQFAHVEKYEAGGESVALENGTPYFLRVGVQTAAGEGRGKAVEATATAQLFNWNKLNNLLLGVVLSAAILISISMAKRKELFVRRIAGLEALDEALGRATEMGKSVLYIHGLREMDAISTIAAVNILGRVARRTAEYDTLLKVTNSNPVVMSVSQETVKEAYIEAGRPDAFNPDNIFIAATDQFSYAAAVEGIMVREKPAAHIMMGYFYAESCCWPRPGPPPGRSRSPAPTPSPSFRSSSPPATTPSSARSCTPPAPTCRASPGCSAVSRGRTSARGCCCSSWLPAPCWPPGENPGSRNFSPRFRLEKCCF